VVDRHRPREVGDEDEGALEDGDEDEIPARIVPRDLGAELVDAGTDLPLGEVDLTEPRLRN
jgi:hypothetical protein